MKEIVGGIITIIGLVISIAGIITKAKGATSIVICGADGPTSVSLDCTENSDFLIKHNKVMV